MELSLPRISRIRLRYILLAVTALLSFVVALQSFINFETRPAIELPAALKVEAGETVPDFALTTVDNETVRLSQLHGKLLILNFWASWCSACLSEIPSLLKLRNRFKDQGLELALLSVDADYKSVVPEFIKQFEIEFPVFTDKDQTLSELFDVHGIPVTIIIGKDRKILEVDAGEQNWFAPEMQKQVAQWLSVRGIRQPGA